MSDRSGERARYDLAEEQAIIATHGRGQTPVCPRCAVPMRARAMGGGSFGLGYSRQREWILCPSCKRSVLFDGRRGTRN